MRARNSSLPIAQSSDYQSRKTPQTASLPKPLTTNEKETFEEQFFAIGRISGTADQNRNVQSKREERENRCEQSISQRGSSGCVDCTEIMYSAVQNDKSGDATGKRGERRGRGRRRGGVLFLSPFPFHASLSTAAADVYLSPAVGVTMVCKGD